MSIMHTLHHYLIKRPHLARTTSCRQDTDWHRHIPPILNCLLLTNIAEILWANFPTSIHCPPLCILRTTLKCCFCTSDVVMVPESLAQNTNECDAHRTNAIVYINAFDDLCYKNIELCVKLFMMRYLNISHFHQSKKSIEEQQKRKKEQKVFNGRRFNDRDIRELTDNLKQKCLNIGTITSNQINLATT